MITPERKLEAMKLLAYSASLELEQLTLEEWCCKYGEAALKDYCINPLPLGNSIVETPRSTEERQARNTTESTE